MSCHIRMASSSARCRLSIMDMEVLARAAMSPCDVALKQPSAFSPQPLRSSARPSEYMSS